MSILLEKGFGKIYEKACEKDDKKYRKGQKTVILNMLKEKVDIP